jgi:hypothetical protein
LAAQDNDANKKERAYGNWLHLTLTALLRPPIQYWVMIAPIGTGGKALGIGLGLAAKVLGEDEKGTSIIGTLSKDQEMLIVGELVLVSMRSPPVGPRKAHLDPVEPALRYWDGLANSGGAQAESHHRTSRNFLAAFLKYRPGPWSIQSVIARLHD